MKTTVALTALTLLSVTAFAQVEQDDMYFNKKDRAKLTKEKASLQAKEQEAFAKAEKPVRFDYIVNTNTEDPIRSDRDVNPEYISRSQSDMVASEEQDYFLENYQYANQNQFNNFSNTLNGWNANPLYYSNYFGPSISGWSSPYYSPFNDPFLMGYNSNPWCNPGFRSGWSVSFSYGWGSNWNYGWNNPYMGLGMYWGNPYWNYGWGNSYWNSGYYGNNWYYPGNTIIIVDDNRGPVYGKRGSRSQSTAYASGNNRSSSSSRSSRVNSPTASSDFNTAGTGVRTRTATTSRSTAEYYTPQWRRTTQPSTSETRSWDNSSNAVRSESYQNRSSSDQRSSGSYSAPTQRS